MKKQILCISDINQYLKNCHRFGIKNIQKTQTNIFGTSLALICSLDFTSHFQAIYIKSEFHNVKVYGMVVK